MGTEINFTELLIGYWVCSGCDKVHRAAVLQALRDYPERGRAVLEREAAKNPGIVSECVALLLEA